MALTDGGEALSLERLEQVEREGEAGRRLIGRAKNLGLHRWGIWAGTERSSILPELGRDDVRCLVVDLGSLATREEQALASAAVLGELWRRREERRPIMIVIDEAHNVCPARPEDPLTAIATEYAVRIAGEGRKFGLYLLVSTQRPQKVHENVLSQCDNLLLMRMNSLADLGFVSDVFSFVPQSLLEQATTFQQGESLAAGLVAPHPAFVRFGRRLARRAAETWPPTGRGHSDDAAERQWPRASVSNVAIARPMPAAASQPASRPESSDQLPAASAALTARKRT